MSLHAVSPGTPPGYQYDYVERTSAYTPSGAGEVDLLTGAAVLYDGATRVKIEYACSDVDTTNPAGFIFRLYDNGVVQNRIADVRGGGAAPSIPAKGEIYYTPSAGVHTFKITAAESTTPNPTANAGAVGGGGSTYSPMFMRITKA